MSPAISEYVYRRRWKRMLAFFFDRAGAFFFFWVKRCPSSGEYRRILLVRIDQIGDVVMALPALKALKDWFPGAEIDMMVAPWAKPVVEGHPGVNEIHCFGHSYLREGGFGWGSIREYCGWIRRLRKRRYDAAIDLRGDARNILLLFLSGAKRRISFGITGGGFLLTDCLSEKAGEHQVERNFRCVEALGCKPGRTGAVLSVAPQEKENFKAKCDKMFGGVPRPWIAIQAGSGYPSKQWPRVNYERLIGELAEKKMGSVLLIGQKGEEPLSGGMSRVGGVYDLIGRTSLRELCVLLESSDLVIGNDSGPSHIAAALGKKTLVLFSGTNECEVWEPRGSRVTVLRVKVPCAPCHERICPRPRHDCMEDLSVGEVFHCAERLLHG